MLSNCVSKRNVAAVQVYANEGVWSYVVTGQAIVFDEGQENDSSGGGDGDDDGDDDDDDDDDGGLGTWGILGISFGGLALLGLLIFLIVKWLGKGSKSSKEADSKPKTETDSLIAKVPEEKVASTAP